MVKKTMDSFVLVTPVRNEERTIEITIRSVIQQTRLPSEWVIVSDESTDGTDDIIQRYAATHAFIRLLRLTKRPARNFASVVFALESGLAALATKDFAFLGLLDGDVRFGPDYYEHLLAGFAADPKLGLAGGLALDVVNGRFVHNRYYLGDVAGAVQFFRRECFLSLGGLVALPEGGWDFITCVRARMNGYNTRTFPELIVEHLKPRNLAEGNLFRRNWQFGVRDYALGAHPLFEVAKCGARLTDSPLIVGAVARLLGYLSANVHSPQRHLSEELINYVQDEQLRRLRHRLSVWRGQRVNDNGHSVLPSKAHSSLPLTRESA